jgi:hypothetical protein
MADLVPQSTAKVKEVQDKIMAGEFPIFVDRSRQ